MRGELVLAFCLGIGLSVGCSCSSDDESTGNGSGGSAGGGSGGSSGSGGSTAGGSGGASAGSGGGAGVAGAAGMPSDAGPDVSSDAGDADAAPDPMCSDAAPCSWKQATPSKSPPVLAWAAMAYDPVKDQMILFGGAPTINGGTLTDKTWLWNGTTWAELTPAAKPSARWTHGMVYDEARQRIVLFGGQSTDQPGNGLADTWEWNGTNWSEVKTAKSPPARGVHGAMAYDAVKQRVVLRGGGTHPGQTLFGDTWEYDGKDWVEITGTGPSARVAPAMAYDAARKLVTYFGGGSWSPYQNDLWTYDGAQWKQLTASGGPSARQSARFAYDPSRQLLLLYGGDDGTLLNDLWEWNGAAWAQVNVTGPPPRCCYAFAHDTLRGETVLFGGPDDQTWIYGQ